MAYINDQLGSAMEGNTITQGLSFAKKKNVLKAI